jgi:antirestriction protein ArdC
MIMDSLLKVNEETPVTKERNLYSEVTQRIIELIEQGTLPWQKPWNDYGLARNYATGHIYTGINYILMNNTGHTIPYFMTYKQVQERGGLVKAGSKAHMVVYFTLMFRDENEKTVEQNEALIRMDKGENMKVLKFIRYFNVFNIEDIENIEFDIKTPETKPKERIAKCEEIVANMPNPPHIKVIKANSAYYSVPDDTIHIPKIEQFISKEEYYLTLFHELVHSTGHKKRLARKEICEAIGKGSQAYGREELVAEMGASFLCATAHINPSTFINNSAAYLSGWLEVLKVDSKFIFNAAAVAQKAVNYILEPAEEKVN